MVSRTYLIHVPLARGRVIPEIDYHFVVSLGTSDQEHESQGGEGSGTYDSYQKFMGLFIPRLAGGP